MIQCPRCGNSNPEELFQHDSDLAGYRDYGRNFTCLKCREDFHLREDESNEQEIENFRKGNYGV